MSLEIETFSPGMAAEAASLFLARYTDERTENLAMPEAPFGDPQEVAERIAELAKTGGVAAVDRKGLAGFLLSGYQFEFKGLRTNLVPEIGHASRGGARVYEAMYPAAAEWWTEAEAQLHIVGALAHDPELRECLWRFGFGPIIEERVRDLTPPGRGSGRSAEGSTTHESATGGAEAVPEVTIRSETHLERLVELESEHKGYYAGSPIFVNKHTDRATAVASLEKYRDEGCAFLVVEHGGSPVADFVVGPLTPNAEGLLLRGTNSAQLRSAYIREPFRRNGIGTSLLTAAVDWAREGGYERLFVEHETANVQGRAFWSRHFAPFVRFSMRYVELPMRDEGL